MVDVHVPATTRKSCPAETKYPPWRIHEIFISNQKYVDLIDFLTCVDWCNFIFVPSSFGYSVLRILTTEQLPLSTKLFPSLLMHQVADMAKQVILSDIDPLTTSSFTPPLTQNLWVFFDPIGGGCLHLVSMALQTE
jgi:hypothetical protein